MSSFDQRAKEWDKKDIRVDSALSIANAIRKNFTLNKEMEIMDFGVGTGLLGFEIAKSVKQVYGVDTSEGMLQKLKEKNRPECSIISYHQDIIKEPISKEFDGIISSMTLHHIQDIEAFFKTIYKNLKDGGFIAIADLESEDGTFHSDNHGVFHYGFKEKELCYIVEKCGFKEVCFENINTIKKPHRDFEVFLLRAIK